MTPGLQAEIDRLNAAAAAAEVLHDEDGHPLPTLRGPFHLIPATECGDEPELTER